MNQRAYAEFVTKRAEVKSQLEMIQGLMYIELSTPARYVEWKRATANLLHVQEILGEAISYLRNREENNE